MHQFVYPSSSDKSTASLCFYHFQIRPLPPYSENAPERELNDNSTRQTRRDVCDDRKRWMIIINHFWRKDGGRDWWLTTSTFEGAGSDRRATSNVYAVRQRRNFRVRGWTTLREFCQSMQKGEQTGCWRMTRIRPLLDFGEWLIELSDALEVWKKYIDSRWMRLKNVLVLPDANLTC